jgi:hypothetical protein
MPRFQQLRDLGGEVWIGVAEDIQTAKLGTERTMTMTGLDMGWDSQTRNNSHVVVLAMELRERRNVLQESKNFTVPGAQLP